MEFDKDSHTDHISQEFNEELESLKTNLMTMGGLVEKQISDAMSGLLDGNSILAQQAEEADAHTNQWEIDIDELCVKIIARRQPTAGDLRMVIAVNKAAGDLERIGDEASKIARHAQVLGEEGLSPTGYAETRHIGVLVRDMLNQSLTAFARYDTELAYRVMKEDREVDQEYISAMRALATYMMEDPRSISRVMNIIWVLRSLERIGDHSRNLCEHLIYLVKGVNVSHSSLKEIKNTIREE